MSDILDIHDTRNRLLYVTDREPVVMVRGSGMYLWDTKGKRYLDLS